MAHTTAPTSRRSGRVPHSNPTTAGGRRKPARQSSAITAVVQPRSVMVDSGHVVIAASIAAQPLYLAWGDGIRTPDQDASATSLVNELGRRKVTTVSYAVPDLEGTIIVSGVRYSTSDKPTRHLYLQTGFDSADAHDSIITEVSVFAGSTMIDGLPSDQSYFTPAELVNPGRMLTLRHADPIYRSPAIRENFEMVITF